MELGTDFDARAREITKKAYVAGASMSERIAAADVASEALVNLNREFGRALAEKYAPHLSTAQQEAVYDQVWANDIGDGFADIEEAYKDLVQFISTYPMN